MILRCFVYLILLLIFSVNCVIAQETYEQIQAYLNDPLGDSIYRKRGIMNGNLVRTIFFNQGEVAHWPDQPSGEWPKGSGHSYLDGVALLIGTKIVLPPIYNEVSGDSIVLVITPIESAYREQYDSDPVTGMPWGLEPVPGYMNESLSIPAMSNDPRTWPENWPLLPL